MVPVNSNKFTVLAIQASIFNWTYLRRYWWYVYNSERVILRIAAQCSLNPPEYAMSTLVTVKSNTVTVLAIQASIFNWKYLRCYWWFIDKSIRVILHICCQIHAQYPVYAMSILVHVKSNIITVLDIQASIFNWTQIRRYWWYIDKSMRVKLHICCQIKRVSSCLRYVNHGPGQTKYS
jgi:hypothetical protein